jgi:hypothetical protein
MFVLCLSCLMGGRPAPAALKHRPHPVVPVRIKFVPLAIEWRQRLAKSIQAAPRLRVPGQMPQTRRDACGAPAGPPDRMPRSPDPASRVHILKSLRC